MASKMFDIIMCGIKIVLWYAAAVVYLISAILNITVAAGFELAFCAGVVAFGVVLGTLNARKFPRLIREYKEMKAGTRPIEDHRRPGIFL